MHMNLSQQSIHLHQHWNQTALYELSRQVQASLHQDIQPQGFSLKAELALSNVVWAAMERQRLMVGGVRCVSRCVTAHAGYYTEPNSKQLIPGGAQRQIKQHITPSWLAPPARFRRGKGSSQSRGWSVCASSLSPPLSQGVSFHPELENSPGMWDEVSARCVCVCVGGEKKCNRFKVAEVFKWTWELQPLWSSV